MTDTPNVNPLNPDQSVQQPQSRRGVQGTASDTLQVDAGKQSASGPDNARVAVYEVNVDIRIGTYRLQADKVTVYEAENRVVAEGSVVFDQETNNASPAQKRRIIEPRPVISSTRPATQIRLRTARAFISQPIALIK